MSESGATPRKLLVLASLLTISIGATWWRAAAVDEEERRQLQGDPTAARARPSVAAIAPGLSATVVDEVPTNALMMCSTCYETHPLREMHVVPTWLEENQRYVGSYRCAKDWKSSLRATRERLERERGDDEARAMLEPVLARVDRAALEPLLANESSHDGALTVLAAIERGELVLRP